MDTVNHSKGLNWQSRLKRLWPFLTKRFRESLSTVLVGCLVGTYLELFLVGKEIFAFPGRPLPEIFSINILFTLIGLPIFILLFLYVAIRLGFWGRIGFILIGSLLMAVLEKVLEEFGFFTHSSEWLHAYSFITYTLYMIFLYSFFYCQHHSRK